MREGGYVLTKKIAAAVTHSREEEGILWTYCVIVGSDGLSQLPLTVLPPELKLLHCLFAPTTGLPIIVDTAGGAAATRLQDILKN